MKEAYLKHIQMLEIEAYKCNPFTKRSREIEDEIEHYEKLLLDEIKKD